MAKTLAQHSNSTAKTLALLLTECRTSKLKQNTSGTLTVLKHYPHLPNLFQCEDLVHNPM